MFVALLLAPAAAIRVAVVGGGIAGGSHSYYLQQQLKAQGLPAADICVYETRDRIGGRLKHVDWGNASVEQGGAAWTDNNHHMIELAAAMHMNTTVSAQRRDPRTHSNIGIWNGSAMLEGTTLVAEQALSVLHTLVIEDGFLRKVEANYARQAADEPFTSVGEFLAWGDLARYTSVSVADFFESRGVSKQLVDYAAVPLTRAIYNRDGGANAFATFASLTAELSHHSVRGGNYQLVEALLKAAGAKVSLSTNVSQIVQRRAARGDGATPRFEVRTATVPPAATAAAGCGDGAEFDAVVIAAPLERTGITLVNVSAPAGAAIDRGFTQWHVTLVQAADLNVDQFRPAKGWACGGDCYVLTTASGTTAATPYVCLQPLGKHGQGTGRVFLVYSDGPIDAATRARLFVNATDQLEQHWPYTFAQLAPITDAPAQTQPVVLADGLYNANALEQIASAMEISAIGGRNAALLVARQAARAQGARSE